MSDEIKMHLNNKLLIFTLQLKGNDYWPILDYWSYFEVKDNLKEMSYQIIEFIWFYDPMTRLIIFLQDDIGTMREKNIAIMHVNAFLCCVPEQDIVQVSEIMQ